MQLSQFAKYTTVLTASIAVHGAIVAYNARMRERWQREQATEVRAAVREELRPLRADIDRAHDRIDQVVLARK